MNIDFNPLFLQKKGIFMVNKKNPFAFKVKQETKKKYGDKRIGKSKPDKENNQLNKRVRQIKILKEGSEGSRLVI